MLCEAHLIIAAFDLPDIPLKGTDPLTCVFLLQYVVLGRRLLVPVRVSDPGIRNPFKDSVTHLILALSLLVFQISKSNPGRVFPPECCRLIRKLIGYRFTRFLRDWSVWFFHGKYFFICFGFSLTLRWKIYYFIATVATSHLLCYIYTGYAIKETISEHTRVSTPKPAGPPAHRLPPALSVMVGCSDCCLHLHILFVVNE